MTERTADDEPEDDAHNWFPAEGQVAVYWMTPEAAAGWEKVMAETGLSFREIMEHIVWPRLTGTDDDDVSAAPAYPGPTSPPAERDDLVPFVVKW